MNASRWAGRSLASRRMIVARGSGVCCVGEGRRRIARSFPGAEDGYLSCRGCQRVGPTSSLSGARRTTDVAR